MTQISALHAAIAEITADVAAQTMATALQAFDARMSFERAKSGGNEAIQTKLKAAQKKFTSHGIATIVAATNIDPQFVNREITAGKRYNIYAVDKVADLLTGLATGTFRNAVNIAVLRSMFTFETAGVPFTGTAALCAVSDKVKVTDAGIAKLLTRHDVSAATGPTQTSSTMNALQTLGAVINTGSAKFPVWALTANPVVETLRARFACMHPDYTVTRVDELLPWYWSHHAA